jgi:hypothetical protein
MIVAWHEVPGTALPKEPSRRVRYDSCRCVHRFEVWREEISNGVSVSRIEMIPKWIGGVLDHVRHLVTLRTRLAVAKAVHLIKVGSSAWIHQRFPNLRNFAWQRARSIALSSSSNIIDTNLSRRVFSLPKETRRTFRREIYLWDQLRPITPYPAGRFFPRTLSQALRAWLRSACPSGTKAIRPSNGLALS